MPPNSKSYVKSPQKSIRLFFVFHLISKESDDAETCKSTRGSDHFHREKKSAATKLEGIEDKLFDP